MVRRLGDERTTFWKKKEEILIAAKNGLVEIIGYLEMSNRVKYILWYFLNATSSTPNFWGGFRGLNPMSRDLLRRNLVQANILLF